MNELNIKSAEQFILYKLDIYQWLKDNNSLYL